MFFAISEVPKDVEIQRQLTSIHIEEWLKEDVFRLRWWLLIGLILLFLSIWFKASDKSRFHAVCMFAALTAIIAMGINEYGDELTLWDYPTDVLPIFPPLSSINLIAMPLIYSIAYQYFNTWKSFILAVLVATAIMCLILEPVFALADLYQLLCWRYVYNIPIYIAAAIGVRALINKITKISKKAEFKKQENKKAIK